MFRGSIGIWAILLWLFFSPSFSFAGEIYRWTDEKGVVHFTDDFSKIPPQYQKQFEKREVKEEVYEIDKKQTVPGKPSVNLQGKPDRAKDDLEAYERKIEAKKGIEKRISGLEEEMRAAEERIKQLKESEEYSRPVTRYRYDNRVRDYVPVGIPLREEKDCNSESRTLKKRLPLLKSSNPKSLEVFNDSGFAIIDESFNGFPLYGQQWK
jgi:predicted nucleotidyltransferase